MRIKSLQKLLALVLLTPSLGLATIYNGNVTYYSTEKPVANEVSVYSGTPYRFQTTPVSIDPSTGNITGVGTFSQSGNFLVSGAASGSNKSITVTNTSNTAGSNAFLSANVGGTSAGDAGVLLTVNGGSTWYMAEDNSDSDNFKIGLGNAVGTTPGLIISQSTQAVTIPTGLTITAGGLTVSAGNISAPTLSLISTTGDISLGSNSGIVDFNGSSLGAVTNIQGDAGALGVTGSLTVSTSLTATAGNITATNGNLVLGTAGNKLSIATGANASVGTATLVGGTVTVNTTAVTASSIILLTRQSIGATGAAALGELTVGTVTPGTSFVINSVQPADATALQASDVSVIGYEIIN